MKRRRPKFSTETFVQLVRAGEVAAGDIDDFVAGWNASNDPRTLAEALGFSKDEYALWVERPDTLDRIMASHSFDGGSPRSAE